MTNRTRKNASYFLVVQKNGRKKERHPVYGKCPKIPNTKVSDKMTYANNADPNQTAPDQDLHCLPFH